MASEAAQTDIFALIARGDTEALRRALQDGAEADARDRWGGTAMSHAAGSGDAEAVRLLLEHGGDPNLASEVGNSPLMIAASHGHLEVVRALIEAGADPETKNKWGMGAADWAKWAREPERVLALLHTRSGGG